MTLSVSIGVVTWNSAATLDACLDAVRRQTQPAIDLLVVDNGSTDDTREILARATTAAERLLLPRNTGFAAAHNWAISRTSGAWYLALNPDVFLEPDFLTRMLAAAAHDPEVGSATGKLLRADDPAKIDSTGIYMVPSQRHLDRGAGERDTGQYDRREYVFGASGAAALYRRAMLDDVRVMGEVFDEDFFAYREDADLAWRAQLLGWRCLYVPDAAARHVRRVTPERRAALPAALNRYSVRNRFLLRLKNQPLASALRFAAPTLARDLQVIGYVLLREGSSVPGLADVIRLLPRTLAKRRAILSRRRAFRRDVDAWFTERARPAPAREQSTR